nr:putative ribonuclease H-like domain-containing protein [Tanacetum cinerariifolium]
MIVNDKNPKVQSDPKSREAETSEAKASVDKPKVVRKNFGSPRIQDWISDSEDKAESWSKIDKEIVKSSFAKIKFVKSKEQLKSPRKTTVNQVLVNTARQVTTAHPKSIVNVARQMSYLSKSAHLSVKRPIHKKTSFLNSNVPQKVNTVRSKSINTARLKAVIMKKLREDMLLLEESLKDEKSQGKLQSKLDETSAILKTFITGIENLVDHKVKVIRCDNGTEFKNKEMNQFCKIKGIMRQYSVARTPQQNRVAKKRNRTLIEAARTMLVDSKLPTTFWAEVVNTACYVQNRVLVCSGPDWLFDIDALTRTMNYEPIVVGTQFNNFAGSKANDNACQARKEKAHMMDSNLQVIVEIRTNGVNAVSKNISNELPFDPKMPTLEDIKTFNFSSDHEDDDEEDDMNNMDTTIQVSLVPTTRINKDHPLDQVIGDLHSTTQTRLFLAYASFNDFMGYQMDVKSAFLYRKIEEEVYVCQPLGFEDPDFPDKVYRVEKAIYGPHQAPRAWYETLSTYMLDNGVYRGKLDKTLFIRKHKDDILLVQVYVDDVIFG